jgi:integrase
VSFPDGPAVTPGGSGQRHGVPAGLLEKLLAAVRPEFRAGVLVFDPADPVFGGGTCRVDGCARAARDNGMCSGHSQRWVKAGRPDPGQFPAAITAPWLGHRPLAGRCQVPGCGFGAKEHRMCERHAGQWKQAGRPDPGPRAGRLPPAAGQPDPPACLVGYCDLWAHPGSSLCFTHRRRWKKYGMPDLAEFARACETPPGARERADLASLPRQLKLELQYALQRRRDDNTTKTRPEDIRAVIKVLAGSGAASLLALQEQEWRSRARAGAGRSRQQAALLSYACRELCALAEGEGGWDSEYPRDAWRLPRLGITGAGLATLQFGGIPQPWLKDLAKRWTRWRISTGLSMSSCYHGVRAVTRFAAFAAQAGLCGLHQADRDLLERYLACLHRDLGGNSRALTECIGELNTFLLAIRRHGWDAALPASAMFFPEDYPKPGRRLPRALAAHVMAQVEAPANLDRWPDPACRLITVILIRCGLRISSATTLPRDCVVTDAAGAPYLRYRNTKMKREALVPIDEELQALIGGQHDRIRQRWPDGTPVLFPRPQSNIDGTRPIASGTYRVALHRWLDACDIRDEHGQRVHLTPHQWRHTLGTTLINRDVPQHVVQKILDHDSAEMTAQYARLSDKTVREHWEKARKVGVTGQPVQISPDGPLGDAAWAKHRLSRATQALPNGYCQLPMVKTCPHANSCLTCPMFVTTAEFLPQHRAQRQATLQIITAAEAAGHARVAEMNKQVAGNLGKIITALEADSDTGEGEPAADAS